MVRVEEVGKAVVVVLVVWTRATAALAEARVGSARRRLRLREERQDAGLRLDGQIDHCGVRAAGVRSALLVVRFRVDDGEVSLGDRNERVDALLASERWVGSETTDFARMPEIRDVEDERAADAIGEIRAVTDHVSGPVQVVALSLGRDAARDLLL